MGVSVYEAKTRLALMPADKPKRESEEAGTYRVIVGFYHTYSSDGRWIDPPLDVTYEHPFPSLSACMKGVKALDRYYKRCGKSVQMRLLTPADIRAEEERKRQQVRSLSKIRLSPLQQSQRMWKNLVAVDFTRTPRQIPTELSEELVLETHDLVQVDGIDRSHTFGGTLIAEDAYQGAIDCYDCDDANAQRVYQLRRRGLAVDVLTLSPWEDRTPDKPDYDMHVVFKRARNNRNHHA